MAFLFPLVLAGFAALAAPVAIHLLNKMRVRHVKWAAMRFLQEAVKKTERKLKAEDLLLLALRCLLVGLLVLAFARPVLNPGGSDTSAGARVAVLILDQSASMGQSDGARTRMDQAKVAVREYLEKLGSGSQAAIFLATNKVDQSSGPLSSDFLPIRRLLDQAKPTGGANDFLAVCTQAVESLRPLAGADREIVIFTDNQATAWRQQGEIQKLMAEAAGIRLRVVAIGGQGEDNLAVTSLKPDSTTPAADQTFGCLVEVSNFGQSAAAGVRVTLATDDCPPSDEKTISFIEPGKSGVVRLSAQFSSPGFHTLKAEIGADRLPVDNQRTLALQAVDEVLMAIVEGTRQSRPQDREGFFLANALVPVDPEKSANYFLKVQSHPATWLEDANLDRQEVIFLANVGQLTPAASKMLRRYVLLGGSLVIFPGPNVDPSDYNNNKDLADLLPARLGTAQDSGSDLKSWQADSYAHPVTAIWNHAQSGSLGTVRASRYFPLQLREASKPSPTPSVPPKETAPAKERSALDDPILSSPPDVIVKYADGTPAVAEMSSGRGRVVLFSSTSNTKWNNLAVHPNFVPLLHRLTSHLSKARADLHLRPGMAFQMPVPAEWVGRDFFVSRPDGEQKARAAGKVERSDRSGLLTYRDTMTPGGYKLLFAGDERPAAAFSVQVSPAESDLRTTAGEPSDFQQGSNAGGARNYGRRRELWGVLLALSIVVAIAEMALAHKFSRAK